MPGVKKTQIEKTSPIWAQEELDRHAYLAAGSFLEKADFALPNADGSNIVYAGTLVGRTYAEKEAGLGFGPADLATDDIRQTFLLIHDVDFDDSFFGEDGQVSLYRHGCQVMENSLPDWDTATADYKAKIREIYQVL